MSNLQNVSVETLKQEIKRREAQETMDTLTAELHTYLNDLGKVESIGDLVAFAKRLVYTYDRANRVLNPSTGKRGKKAKTS